MKRGPNQQFQLTPPLCGGPLAALGAAELRRYVHLRIELVL